MEKSIQKYAIIVAGGVGNRAGGFIPKQFQELCGFPVLWWSVRRFVEEDPNVKIILVLNADYLDVWQEIYESLPNEDGRINLQICTGGKTRFHSVKKGLELVPNGVPALVAVHDAARPLADTALLKRGWETAKIACAAVPVDDVTDSLRFVDETGNYALDRSRYFKVQTPQVFDSALLKQAYTQEYSEVFTDDASVVESFGHKVAIFKGNSNNIKVTNPIDFKIAEIMMKES